MCCRVIPALGAGAAYGVAQGTPAQAPVMAIGFAGFSALFYKVLCCTCFFCGTSNDVVVCGCTAHYQVRKISDETLAVHVACLSNTSQFIQSEPSIPDSYVARMGRRES